jgi:hypothetical protein
MFDQLFESFRKASESSLQAQQALFKQWAQQLPLASSSGAGAAGPRISEFQRRLAESMTETLNRHREVLDSTYRSGIQLIEQAFRVTDAKSPEDYRRVIEDLWRKLSDTFKEQSEVQVRELQKTAERWMDAAQKARG